MSTLVFCSGTGRTGKTSVGEALEAEGWLRLKSPTRDFYATLGVANETELFTKSQPERAVVQRNLFAMFMDWLEKTTAITLDKNVILERSPIDYLAYLLFHDWDMTIEQYDDYIVKIANYFARSTASGWHPIVLLFPFPTEWMKAPDSDAFRHSKFGKDLTIHALVRHIAGCVSEFAPGEATFYELDDTSVKERVEDIKILVSQEAMLHAVSSVPAPTISLE